MNILTRTWQLLTNPNPSILDIEQRRQSSLLAGLILSLVLTSLIASSVLIRSSGDVSLSVIGLWLSIGFLLGIYWINHSGRYRLSAIIFVALNLLVTCVMPVLTHELAWLLFMNMVLLTSAMLLPGLTLAIFFICLTYQLILGLILPTTTAMSNLGILIVFSIIGPLVLVFMVHRNQLERERELEMQGINEALRRSDIELRENYDMTLEAWATVLEIRDRETEGHSRRLVDLSTRLGRALGLTEEEILILRRGALIHDIGKLAIPDEILLKPQPLDENEIRLMQKHPMYAKKMLSDISFLQPSICVAYSHHESWDGQGYPEGLKGEEIPFLARIFAVVDAWDALRSDRVYRPGWSSEQTIQYLKNNSGIKYDSRIVEVFLDFIEA